MRTILYFSPTGNVKHIATLLKESLGTIQTEFFALEKTKPEELTPTNQLIILYSIHAFNPPRTVRRFVQHIPPGLYNDISLISVGCAESWINQAASSDLRKTLEKKGYPILVDESLAMPLTFILSFPDELIKKQITAARNKVNLISKSIISKTKTERHIPTKAKFIHMVGKAESPAAKLFGLELHSNKNCTSCGICVRNCPEKNIHFNKKDKPKFGLNCLMCMRCIYNCPEKAVSPRIAKFIPVKGGYNLQKHLEKLELSKGTKDQ
jgi:ferredoxin